MFHRCELWLPTCLTFCALLAGCSSKVPATVLRVHGRSADITTLKVKSTIRYGDGLQTIREDDVTVAWDFSRVTFAEADLQNPLSYAVHVGISRLERSRGGETSLVLGSGRRIAIAELQGERLTAPTGGGGGSESDDAAALPALLLPIEMGLRLNVIPRTLCSAMGSTHPGGDAIQLAQQLIDSPRLAIFGEIQGGGVFTGTLQLTPSGRVRIENCLRKASTGSTTRTTLPTSSPN